MKFFFLSATRQKSCIDFLREGEDKRRKGHVPKPVMMCHQFDESFMKVQAIFYDSKIIFYFGD